MNPPESGYNLRGVFLLESNFKRFILSNYQNKQVEQDFKFDIEVSDETDNNFFVTLKLTLTSTFIDDKSPEIEATIKMTGHFQKVGSPQLDQKIFEAVNAPAILTPFVREHLSSLTVKAGLKPIYLPIVNFKAKKTGN